MAATSSTDVYGKVFMELVDRTREELLGSMHELSEQAKMDQDRMKGSITAGLIEHSTMVRSFIRSWCCLKRC